MTTNVIIDADNFSRVEDALRLSAESKTVLVIRTQDRDLDLTMRLEDTQKHTKSVKILDLTALEKAGMISGDYGGLWGYAFGYLEGATKHGITGIMSNMLDHSNVSAMVGGFLGGLLNKPDSIVVYSDREDLPTCVKELALGLQCEVRTSKTCEEMPGHSTYCNPLLEEYMRKSMEEYMERTGNGPWPSSPLATRSDEEYTPPSASDNLRSMMLKKLATIRSECPDVPGPTAEEAESMSLDELEDAFDRVLDRARQLKSC